jgi:hypothetical protein
MSAVYVVVIQCPGRPPQTREFTARRVVIGRETGEIVLPDERCSSTHAELLFDGRSVVLRDLGSTNGTWVAGQRIVELAWATGGAVQIGAHVLTLQEVRVPQVGPGRTLPGHIALPSPLAGSVEAPSPVVAAMRLQDQLAATQLGPTPVPLPAAAASPSSGASSRKWLPIAAIAGLVTLLLGACALALAARFRHR